MPCVIYLHGNSSSRVAALKCIPHILPMNMTLFCFDFSGSGLSDGEYISLGFYEREDLKVVIEYLRNSDKVTTVGLWGRSMGAVTALMHANRDHSIAGLVLDSPFTSLPKLSKQLFRKYSKKIPSFLFTIAFSFVKSTVKSKAKFDLNKIQPINHVHQSFIPALFIAAKDDDFIQRHHAQELFAKYQGDKNFLLCEGNHNSPREGYVLTSAGIFLHNSTLANAIPEYEIKGAESVAAKFYPPWNTVFFFDVNIEEVKKLVQPEKEDELIPKKKELSPPVKIGVGVVPRKLQQQSEKIAPREVDDDIEDEAQEEQKGEEIDFSFDEAIEDVLKLSEEHCGEKDELRIKVGKKLDEWSLKLSDQQRIMILEMIG